MASNEQKASLLGLPYSIVSLLWGYMLSWFLFLWINGISLLSKQLVWFSSSFSSQRGRLCLLASHLGLTIYLPPSPVQLVTRQLRSPAMCKALPWLVSSSGKPPVRRLQVPCCHYNIWDDPGRLPRAEEDSLELCDHRWSPQVEEQELQASGGPEAHGPGESWRALSVNTVPSCSQWRKRSLAICMQLACAPSVYPRFSSCPL